jgi:hypothetical protein
MPFQPLSKVRLIRPNHNVSLPRRIVVLDTEAYRHPETDGERQTYRLGVALYLELSPDLGVMDYRIARCPSPADLWGQIDRWARIGGTLYVFAHNAGYDLQLADGLRQMNALGWRVRRIWDDTGRCLVCWRKGHRYVWLIDTYFILRGSLKEIGDTLGLPKWELPEDADDDGLWWDYCARDVFILALGVVEWLKFIRDHDLGSFRPTLAGQSFAAYRHRFMGERIYAARDDDVVDLELEAYRGGRSEAFYIGTLSGGPYYKLDVNSMYPYVMAAFSHPVAPLWKGEAVSVEKLLAWSRRYWVMAEVWLDTPEPAYGVKMNGKLVFPIGRFRAVLCGEEVRYALEHGHVRKVGRFVIYRPSSPFRHYVNYFWQLRQEAKARGNRILDRNAKLMLNALYGKFGERGRRERVIGEGLDLGWGYEQVVDADTGETSTLWRLGNQAIISETDGVAWYASPAMAASITAAARVYLWRLIRQAGWRNVYYTDTDSLIVNARGMGRLSPFINPSALGLLKVEGETDSLEIRGVKDYSFGGEERIAGLGNIVGRYESGALKVAKWLGLRSAMVGGWLGEVRIRFFPWVRAKTYGKGKVGADGWVVPFRLHEF